MFGWLSSLLLLSSPVAAAHAPPPLPERSFVAWPHEAAGARVRVAGLTLVNTSRACTDRDSKDRDPGHCWVAGVSIERPGTPAVTLTGPAGMVAKIAVGAMTRGGAAGVILSTFIGGAHCCEVYDVALPAARGWTTTRLSWTAAPWEGGPRPPQTEFDGGLAGFPRDIDGDGVADFVLSDDRFDYTFASYAGSAAPPVVLNWTGAHWTDVSASPRFASLFAADLADRRRGCLAAEESEHRGVCAAYAADAARLGRLDTVWPTVVAQTANAAREVDWGLTRCPVASVNDRCPPGADIRYADYPAALRAFLTVTGYLPKATFKRRP